MRKPDPFFVDGDQVAFLQPNADGKWFVILEADDIYALDAVQVHDFALWCEVAQAYIEWASAHKVLAKNRVDRDYADDDDV